MFFSENPRTPHPRAGLDIMSEEGPKIAQVQQIGSGRRGCIPRFHSP